MPRSMPIRIGPLPPRPFMRSTIPPRASDPTHVEHVNALVDADWSPSTEYTVLAKFLGGELEIHLIRRVVTLGKTEWWSPRWLRRIFNVFQHAWGDRGQQRCHVRAWRAFVVKAWNEPVYMDAFDTARRLGGARAAREYVRVWYEDARHAAKSTTIAPDEER